jgi:hypothetical protein
MKRSHVSFVLVMAVAHGAAAQVPASPGSPGSPAPFAPVAPAPASPPDGSAAELPLAPPGSDRAERDAHERAEFAFQRRAIHVRGPGWRDGWIPLQGDLDRELGTEDFLDTVGRPDLAEAYVRDRRTGAVIAGISAAGLVAGAVLIVSQIGGQKDCSSLFPSDAFSACVDANVRGGSGASFAPGIVLSLAGAVGILVGAGYAARSVDTDQARTLADAYNQRLRRELGLPTLASRPVLRDVKLTPYVARGDAGLTLGARF